MRAVVANISLDASFALVQLVPAREFRKLIHAGLHWDTYTMADMAYFLAEEIEHEIYVCGCRSSEAE